MLVLRPMSRHVSPRLVDLQHSNLSSDDWYPFICDLCESERKTGSTNHHWTHPVVRVQEIHEDEDKDEDGLAAKRLGELKEGLEQVKTQMDQRIKALEENVVALQHTMDTKLTGIERMLGKLLAAKSS